MAGPPQFSTDRFALKLGLFYAAYFFFGGVQLPFFPLWLEARGLDARTIGMVIAVPTLVRIVVTPIVTHAADRHRALKATLWLGSVIGLIGMTAAGLVHHPIAILAAFTLAMAALSPMLSLSDAYALSGLGARERNYGPVRLWGSVAFIVANLTGGVLLNVLAPGNLIWVICLGNCALAVAAMLLPRMPSDTAPRAAGSRSHLRQPAFLAIAAAASLIQASHAVYYGFSTLDWTAKGFDGVTIGILWALGVVAEIVLFACAARLPRSIGPVTLILIGAGGGILRWSAMTFDPPPVLLFPLQLLHALSFGATHLGTMMFLSQNAPEQSRAAAQGDVSTASSLAMAAASALAGVLYGASGAAAYAAMAVLAAAGGVFAALAARFTRRLPP